MNDSIWLECWHKGSSTRSIGRSTVDEKRLGQATGCGQCTDFHAALWYCWMGDRKCNQSVQYVPLITMGFPSEEVEEED